MADMADSTGDESLLPEWRDYIRRYPTVGDALSAARRGEDTSVLLGDSLSCRMKVIADGSGPDGVIETVYYLNYMDAVETALLNAALDGTPDPTALIDAVIRWIPSALSESGIEEWLTPSMRITSEVQSEEILEHLPNPVEVVTLNVSPEDGDSFPPRFGIRELVRVDGSETWQDADSGAYGAIEIFAEAIHFENAPDSFRRALIEAGARLVVCSKCGEYITNGFEEWPALWCSLDEEGPVCGSGHPPARHIPKVVK